MEVKPHPNMKKIYLVYFIIVLVLGVLWWAVPLAAYVRPLRAPISLTLIAIVVVVLYWIPKYYKSIRYVLGEDHLEVEYGVWWRKRSYVPYNRITNLHIAQGPISRAFGVASLGVQTAGFSASSSGRTVGGKIAEAVLGYLKVEDLQKVRELISEKIRVLRPMAVEAGEWGEGNALRAILDELRCIRGLLEERGGG